ncbi:MAG TPA: universal stress protein [Rhodanobacteraceae bacterium]|nr:universal stress protein [Rhodanobacteraceae bacterium]
MQDILAYCADVRMWSPGMRYAAELAAALGASLTGIHVTPPLPLKAPEGMPASICAELIAYAQDEVQEAMVAGPRFAAWAGQFGVQNARWQVALGDTVDVIGIAANWSDIIILERPSADDERTIDLIIETLLSGFACVVVPEATYAIGRLERIAVLYDGSCESIRALHDAIPLLRKATHVVLLRGSWPVKRPEAFPAFDPEQHLSKHGIAFESEDIDAQVDEAADAWLEMASRRRVDLIVAGAAGKSRLGDIRLDPIPRYLLQYASIPLFLKG